MLLLVNGGDGSSPTNGSNSEISIAESSSGISQRANEVESPGILKGWLRAYRKVKKESRDTIADGARLRRGNYHYNGQ